MQARRVRFRTASVLGFAPENHAPVRRIVGREPKNRRESVSLRPSSAQRAAQVDRTSVATRPASPSFGPYTECASVAGKLSTRVADGKPVEFRRVIAGRQRIILAALVGANALAGLVFIASLVVALCVAWGRTRPALGAIAATGALMLVIVVEVIRTTQNAALWVFAAKAEDPIPMIPLSGLRVAVLTTIVPAKEPIEVVTTTLRAMRELIYDGFVDVWILDEGDDPQVRQVAKALGVHHFTRKGRSEYNQAAGEFRTRTKSGNHNAWRAEHEHEYDLVAQMDPDHVPVAAFLERLLGYFRDPDVAFVVAPQVYGNVQDGFIPHAAAAQGYLFTGIVQRGANGLGAPVLIGTNHVYRTKAWAQIGGYQDSIIEDHLTGMRVSAAVNPATGNRWKGVATPDVVAVGQGPTSWTDYFNQQTRWVYGIWDILIRHSPSLLPELGRRQRLSYALIQFFYPSVGAIWVLGNLATVLCLTLAAPTSLLGSTTWRLLWVATMLTWLALFAWLRRFNLAAHERRESGIHGLLLSLFTGPVYVAAGLAALSRRPLSYAVTPKGDLSTPDSLLTFRHHLAWAAGAALTLGAGLCLGHAYPGAYVWVTLTLCLSAMPPALFAVRRFAIRGRGRNGPVPGVEFRPTGGLPEKSERKVLRHRTYDPVHDDRGRRDAAFLRLLCMKELRRSESAARGRHPARGRTPHGTGASALDEQRLARAWIDRHSWR